VRTGTRGDVEADQGVFNIMVGAAITLAIADGNNAAGELADVFYTDCWKEGLFARGAKLEWLTRGADAGELPNSTEIERGPLDDWRPRPFENGEWVSIREAFEFDRSGVQTKRDAFVYSPSRSDLEGRINVLLSSERLAAEELFRPTTARPLDSVRATLALVRQPQDLPLQRASYRPLDTRWLCNVTQALDRPRPDLQAAWGIENVGLYTMPSGVGAGPAVWCHGLLPDYHSFSGRGGYAFPLYDRRAGPGSNNLDPTLVAALTEAYGAAQTPEDIFDSILCLLSAQSYTRRFAEDLEDTFPHIPFPADPTVFARAVAIGREIRALEAFQRDPVDAFAPRDFCRIVGQPGDDSLIADIAYADGTLSLWKDGNAAVPAFTGLSQAVWDFAVSGYRVLPRWIEGRKGLPVTLALMRELRDVAARIHELLHWFAEADLVLEATLADTLTREELGFAPEVEEAEADQGDE
jgi:hypothetical protein